MANRLDNRISSTINQPIGWVSLQFNIKNYWFVNVNVSKNDFNLQSFFFTTANTRSKGIDRIKFTVIFGVIDRYTFNLYFD